MSSTSTATARAGQFSRSSGILCHPFPTVGPAWTTILFIFLFLFLFYPIFSFILFVLSLTLAFEPW